MSSNQWSVEFIRYENTLSIQSILLLLFRDISVIGLATIASVAFGYFVIRDWITTTLDRQSKEQERTFKHERHMESAKLTRKREENKHLTQDWSIYYELCNFYIIINDI